MSTSAISASRRELAHRAGNGIEVTLYWRKGDNRTTIEIWNAASGQRLVFEVAPDRALDAYNHPFAHLAARDDDFFPALGLEGVR
jgi:hypothetical protein